MRCEMQAKLSYISISLFILSAFLWKNIFELIKWKQQFVYGRGPNLRRTVQEIIEVSQIESNCGIQYTCPTDSFPVYLSTGTEEYPPKLCISGKHLINREIIENRGLHAAIIEPVRFDIIAVKHFNKSSDMLAWLEEVYDNDILIIFTSDEPSLKLTTELTQMLNDLGSGMVHNLRFKSQWFMITQKGTTGFTIYEKVTFSKNKNWGDMIEFRSCIPRKIPKKRTVADETLHENKMRAKFCAGKKDDKYKGFCQESRFELIIPALLTNKSLIGNLAYSSPLFLFASDDFEILTASMDSLLHQPGVFIPLITILYEENQTDVPYMGQMYGMRTLKTTFAKNYLDKLNQARKISLKEHPEQPFIIVIDQNVILSPDFLFFMAQTIHTLRNDDTVSAISAWPSNYYSRNGNVHLAYRVEGTPKFAALVPVKSRNDLFGELIAPDVPRVQGPKAYHLPSLEADNWIMRPQDLTKERYFHKMVMLQQLGEVIPLQTVLTNCSISILKTEISVIYLSYDEKVLSNAVYCLGILEDQFGMYEGIVRLTVLDKTVLIISSESSFYRSRMALTKGGMATSYDIGMAYRPPYYFSYEKKEKPRIPNVEVNKPFAMADVYSTSYGTSYIKRSEERDMTSLMKKFRFFYTEYPKQTCLMPLQPLGTEYRQQFFEKPLPKGDMGYNVENLTSCPVITTGRDEREAAPLSNNIAKWLDIYVSTTRQDFRKYSEQEQKSIATKEVVTVHETMEIPKGKGYGMRGPALAGQDLERRDRNMTDPLFSKQEFKLRQAHKVMPMVPRYGIKTEYSSTYVEPSGFARRNLFSSPVEYTDRNTTSTTQAVCPPGMFSTEYDVINKQTTPQTVV